MSKSLSVVVNTAALGEKASEVESSGGVPHGFREYLLNTWILPRLIRDDLIDEIIVAGEFRSGDDWIYVECPSENFDCTDALRQRQAGFEASSGDRIIFMHDDHTLGKDFAKQARSLSYPVLSPSRWTRMRDPRGERLNDGWGQGYAHGHCIVMSREVCEDVPWSEVPEVFTWDVEMTKRIIQSKHTMRFVPHLRVWDVEAGSEPWR